MKAGKKNLCVLVVDDSAYNRKMVKTMLLDMDEVGSVDVASNGEEAIKTVMADPPDVITLDLNMPRMDGFTFLRWLMRNRPLPVVVVSAEGGEKNVFKALDLGALDFVVKPLRYASERIIEVKSELQEKVRAVAGKDLVPYLKDLKKTKGKPETARGAVKPKTAEGIAGVLIIGASTGGPSAIQRVLAQMSADFPLPIIVVQHMPPIFTKQFSVRLDKNTPFKSREATEGAPLVAGQVLVVPGGNHLEIVKQKGYAAAIREKSKGDRFVPSIDRTMASAANTLGANTIGVLLTGMGSDGAEGLLKIRQAGGQTIAESEETTVVFGMPRAAVQKGAAGSVLVLDRIPQKVQELSRIISGLKNNRSDVSNLSDN
ncbi:chemotaxis-specific protein-glutamate methyltransferase CheB [bacterium]|nr:MAG: chemotaxis-specific protein-glutamate methyltransferase CheB [bacterium]